MWLIAAFLSALFASLTTILAKCGVRRTDSDVATAVRTGVVLIFSWLMAALTGEVSGMAGIGGRSLVFLVLSGLSTGMSWICYFKALSMGDVNKVTPIDKSSTVLSVLLAIVIFNETDRLALKLASSAVLAAGILLMVEKRASEGETRRGWVFFAVLSAVFAALTGVLAKIGVEGVPSNLASAIRTVVVLIMAWAIVLARGKREDLRHIDRRELTFICLSGLATGASWLCYYYALQNGKMSVVVPVDKLSVVLTVTFSYFAFGEKLTKKSLLGLSLIVLGTLLMLRT